ncbi:tetratricopeptide repeat protein [Emticicia sp. BO119]|uniref:tetratricopeptide repeat protein n=1 Tax=Emticicia sp. BO119 TaxID=2757768 RepID=UPI0015F0580E|nr:tetratricopeptide repeat protein [Emticicia sp. BO119]MBA4850072.1 tetratricopeptide repeat protein [Emticicia sp. BO119]
MNTWFFYIILVFLNIRSLTNVSERNRLKIEAGEAFMKKNYTIARDKYQNLANISFNLEPEARLNMAHSYFYTQDTARALIEYKRLLRVTDEQIFTGALLQIGVINAMQKDSLTALQLFKEALQKNPDNITARYNYELLKKQLPDNNPEPPPPAQINENQNTETQQSVEKKDELESTIPEKMSREKALQILEAMKTNELQYTQKHKGKNEKNNKNSKDW